MARELKYNTHFTDLDALQRELGVSQTSSSAAPVEDDDADEREDDYEDWTGTGR